MIVFCQLALFKIVNSSYANAQGYIIAVPNEGMYKITQAAASAIGLGDISQISVYGVSGMLPQRLDSTSLLLQEIPGQQIGDVLYFYLSGPNTFNWEEQLPLFQINHYSNIQHYYISGQSASPKRITKAGSSSPVQSDSPDQTWYSIITYHQEEYNMLQSGRDWYGHRMFSGQESRIDVNTPSATDRAKKGLFAATVMAQSIDESRVTAQVNGQPIQEVAIPSIPNSTYGIKGREALISNDFDLPQTSGFQIQFRFETGDRNGAGYLRKFWVGIPIDINRLENGVLYRPTDEAADIRVSIPENRKIWLLGTETTELESETLIPAGISKIAYFNPSSVPDITVVRPADVSLRQNSTSAELLIISPSRFLSEANRLASHKNGQGILTQVVLLDAIYDAFGYGNPDPTAIRNFVAFTFHRSKKLKNLLLLGKGTFDYKNILQGDPNLLPTYSSRSSLNPLTTYSSDDYFGFLTFGDGEWVESNSGDHHLTIGIGRIPATNVAEASQVIDKIIRYSTGPAISGDWKRNILLIADDGDNNIHLNDAESHAAFLSIHHPEFIIDKLYLDRFEQLNTGSAQESPAARAFLNEWLGRSGVLINYIGHGNESALTAEGLFRVTDIADMPESDRLPVFVTATCEFGRHDSPFIRSGAERLLIAPRKGAIALLTTGRPVFSSVNFLLNRAFVNHVFSRPEGDYLSLGEIFMQTKNQSLSGPLNRNFSLLGDPSLRINLPSANLGEFTLTDRQSETELDTLRALQQIRFSGKVHSLQTTEPQPGFNGEFQIRLLDKPLVLRTRGDESIPAEFFENQAVIHQGNGKIEDGLFEGSFFVGKNIAYPYGNGTIQLFGMDSISGQEFMGAARITIGGTHSPVPIDRIGPQINIFRLDSDGPIATTQVKIRIEFFDLSGINVSPIQVGQDITLVLNGDDPIVITHLYSSLDAGFERGFLELELNGLREGENRISVTAFDNFGNRSTQEARLDVKGTSNLRILSNLAYPNPSTDKVSFQLSHNRPGENIQVSLHIISADGREIFSLERRFPNAGGSILGLEWNFSNGFAVFPAKGMYIYRLEVYTESDHTFDQVGGKLLVK